MNQVAVGRFVWHLMAMVVVLSFFGEYAPPIIDKLAAVGYGLDFIFILSAVVIYVGWALHAETSMENQMGNES